MARKANFGFTAIRSEGALLPPDILERIAKEDGSLGGLSEADYHVQGKKLREEASSAWNSLQGSWSNFRTQREKLSRSEPGAQLTRERWLMPLLQELGFGRIPPNRESISIDGQSYAISHTYGHAPLHLVGCNVDLDARTAGVVGAAKISPHGLVQSFLNATKDNLWGVVSNGLKLRLLRDNASLTRQAYVEFDLEAILEGELYSDFVLLWLVCHQSRFESERPEDCWLEKWTRAAQDQGKRALDALRGGVEKSIVHLGQGFLRHPANSNLKEKLRSGELDKQDYYRQLLRLVYRLLFLFVAEDREVLLSPDATDEARELYRDHYSTQRLRKVAESHRGSRHGDLWHPLRLVMDKLGRDEGCTALGLAPLGGSLFAARSTADLNESEIANNELLGAIRCLAYADDGGQLRGVDYKNLGSEELGSVYESLLELHPDLDSEGYTFSLETASGNERKTTGSYYTADSLIQCLLDTALDPVVDDAVKNASKKFTADDAESAEAKAILDLKVVDPAVGSGHFLIAAAHRIAKRLAGVRTGEDEPSPESYRRALRDVIAKSVYGIDMNPMAVELCKVALWMEGVEQGKPLPFLDHHIQCGNSLLGATAELIADCIPDGAFNPVEGDDPALCRDLKRKNKAEREGQMGLFDPEVYSGEPLLKVVEALENTSDHTITGIHEKERQLEKLRASEAYAFRWLLANAWCASFALPKVDGATVVTTGTIRRAASGGKLTDQQLNDIEEVARQYRFFHPHLAFPAVFAKGGFDVVLGNPPWDRVKTDELEWFTNRYPRINDLPNAGERRKEIDRLRTSEPTLDAEFKTQLRWSDVASAFLRGSGRFPLCGRGDINLYSVFAEMMRSLLHPSGQVGAVIPSGLATDDTTKAFFGEIVELSQLRSFYEFENRGFFEGAGQGHMVRFALITLCRTPVIRRATDYVFQAQAVAELSDPGRHFQLTSDEIRLLNPNTRTCPIFKSRRDAEVTLSIYRKTPVLVEEGVEGRDPWGLIIRRFVNMGDKDSLSLAETAKPSAGEWLRVYEAKMVGQYNHREGDYTNFIGAKRPHVLPSLPAESLEQNYEACPYYWFPSKEFLTKLRVLWQRDWMLVWRDVTDARASARTTVAAIIPLAATDFTLRVGMPRVDDPCLCACFLGALNSLVFDYCARQAIGGLHLSDYIIKQLPLPEPERFIQVCAWDGRVTYAQWIAARVLELTFTAHDLASFAADLGWRGEPFPSIPSRREEIVAELDAAMFHLFGVPRADVEHILDSFRGVNKREIHKHGVFRTKALVLATYDAMATAIANNNAYQTGLVPPPADGWLPLPPAAPHNQHLDSAVIVDARSSLVADLQELVLVAPEPAQPKLSFAPDGKQRQRLLINGETAVFVRKRKENGTLFITAIMEATGEERTFSHPPAKVTILG